MISGLIMFETESSVLEVEICIASGLTSFQLFVKQSNAIWFSLIVISAPVYESFSVVVIVTSLTMVT